MRVSVSIGLFVLFILNGCNNKQAFNSEQPEIHFSLNDTNLMSPVELLFLEGEYHLFYQCLSGGVMQWGHATSTDLIQWNYLPPALSSDSSAEIASGSIIVDWNNSSGFGENNSPMVALFTTLAKEKQSPEPGKQILFQAYSNDNGLTWKKSGTIILHDIHNPVKDLKIVWHEETQQWIMLALTSYNVRFYTSTNLIDWDYLNVFEGDTNFKVSALEHLSFFRAKVKGSNEQKWILSVSGNEGSPNGGSGTQYFVGDFDGYSFNYNGNQSNWLDNGSDNYAGVILSNYMDFNKPLFYLGWINNQHYPEMKDSLKLRAVYTLPRELMLAKVYGNYKIISRPIEISGSKNNLIPHTEYTGELVFKKKHHTPLEINLDFDVSNKLYFGFAKVFGVQLTNGNGEKLTIGYHNYRHYFFISEQKDGLQLDRTNIVSYSIDKPILDFKIIIDKNTVELFSIDGMISLTKKYFISSEWNQISLFAEDGDITLNKGSITELRSSGVMANIH